MSRRRILGVGSSVAALALVGCGEEDTPADEPTAEPEATVPAAQASPEPTQPPIASPVAGYLDPARWQGRSLVVASAGIGDYFEALEIAFFDAFAAATGATVRHQRFGRDGIDNLVDQVNNDEIVWDVMLTPTASVLPLAQGGYLTAIDYNVVDPTALYDELLMQHGAGAAMYSTIIAYQAGAERVPAGWDEFWNLSIFGGTRALRRGPVGTLEFALLADGVSQDVLYPLDVDRAFAALNRIREAVIFYEDSQQPVELVGSGQVGLASAWSARVALPDIAPFVIPQWNGGMISADSWIIPRGAENTDVAMSFVNFATRAVPTANFSRLQPFGPVNREALELLRPDILAMMPNAPAHFEVQFFEGWSYWADQRESLTAQFEDWLLNPLATPESARPIDQT